MRTPEYDEYLKSWAWKEQRFWAIERARNQCKECGEGLGTELDVHHVTYERLGHELPEDLVVLCRLCHDVGHRNQRWNRRLDGWATKVYGEGWQWEQDAEEVEDRFVKWLEKRE